MYPTMLTITSNCCHKIIICICSHVRCIDAHAVVCADMLTLKPGFCGATKSAPWFVILFYRTVISNHGIGNAKKQLLAFHEDREDFDYLWTVLVTYRKCKYMSMFMIPQVNSAWQRYSISQEICTRFLLCCALLWLYIDWFSHIHQAYFTGTVAI